MSYGVSGSTLSAMSVRKLCSNVVKSSNSSFLRRKYFTTARVVDPRQHQLKPQVNQTANYSQALGSLTKDQAHDLVFRLNDEERDILMRTLEQYHVKQEKGSLECKYQLLLLCVPLINLMNVCSWQADFASLFINFLHARKIPPRKKNRIECDNKLKQPPMPENLCVDFSPLHTSRLVLIKYSPVCIRGFDASLRRNLDCGKKKFFCSRVKAWETFFKDSQLSSIESFVTKADLPAVTKRT